MKRIIFTTLIGLVFFISNSQINFQEHLVDNITWPGDSYAADLDSDDDLDIIISSTFSINWYENIDGQGTFVKHVIHEILDNDWGISVCAKDIDGDNDIDVISSHLTHMSWYENIDGQGNFTDTEHVIYPYVNGYVEAYLEDIDGDDDIDVVSSIKNENKISWHENIDGQGNFIEHIVSYTYSPLGIYAEDIDGDNDMDIISPSGIYIKWYENLDGMGYFLEHNIPSSIGVSVSIYAKDIDGDDDIDILSSSDSAIAWYENNDGQGNFVEHIIPMNVINSVSIFAEDVDGDNDIDILFTSGELLQPNPKIAWGENVDGQGSFVEHLITSNVTVPNSVRAIDLDQDNDMDVVSTSVETGESYGKIAWYENLGSLGITDKSVFEIRVFPNPIKNMLNIQSNNTITRAMIYNQSGQLILSAENSNRINFSSFSQGLYFIKIMDESGNIETRKVIKF